MMEMWQCCKSHGQSVQERAGNHSVRVRKSIREVEEGVS